MSGTIKTVSALLAEQFDNSSGAITPQQMRNLTVTMANVSGGIVTPEMYGAVGNGSTNDTTAFANALAAAQVVIVGPKNYVVGNLSLPNGGVLLGRYGYATYDASSNVATGPVKPRLIAPAGATDIINISNASFGSVCGMVLDGTTTGANGISDTKSGAFFYFADLTIINCNYGIGGTRANQTVGVARFENVVFGSCTHGVFSPVDCQFNGCEFSANGSTGCNVGPSMGSSSWTNCRFEWNSGQGILFNGAADCTVAGCWSDSNTGAVFHFTNTAQNINITGCSNRFNGTSRTAGHQSHFYFNGSTDIVISGNSCWSGTHGGSNVDPLYCIEWAGTNTHIVLSGNNFSRFGTAVSTGTAPSSSYRASGNLGLTDVNV